MTEKIFFLGTAGDLRTASNYRSAGGILLILDDFQFHLNPGIGAIESAKKHGYNLRNNVALIVTDNSLIACNDMNAVCDYMTLEGEDRHGVLIGAVSIINGSNDENPLLKEKTRKSMERVIGLRAGDKVAIGDVNVYALKLHSFDSTAIGVILESENSRIGFVPETGFSTAIAEQYLNVDTLILSVKHSNNFSEDFALNVHDAIKFASIVKPKTLIITGLGQKLASESSVNLLREIQKKTGYSTTVAEDGQTLTLFSSKKN